jgi:hypothetical protein
MRALRRFELCMSDSDDFVDLFDLDLNESFKRFAKPMIDTSLSFEETMESFSRRPTRS